MDDATVERDFLTWIRRVEKRAMLPLKWSLLLTALLFWMLNRPALWPPPVDLFSLFLIYGLFTAGETYFLWLSRVTLQQVRWLALLSYIIDIAFVTLLIYFDVKRYPSIEGPASDFYIYYILLILRAFVLFRTPRANLWANTAVAALFLWSLFWQDAALFPTTFRASVIRVVFLWLVILMSWYIVDVINQQKAQLATARENLIRTESLALLGEIAAGVAHEINNPLGIISANAEYLEKQALPDDPRREDFAAISREARRCGRIVQDLLTYARPGPRGLSEVDLRELNDEVMGFIFNKTSNAQVQTQANYPTHMPKITADADQLRQALMNVYLNALEAVKDQISSPRITCDMQWDAQLPGARIEVTDNGKGMTKSGIFRAFDPFYTTKQKGTGLGLSLTRRIIEAHGGTIALDSNTGAGTRVTISLPAKPTFTA